MKIFNKKRVASMALAGVLALSATVPAFAAQPGDTTLTAKYEEPTLNVTVTTTGAGALINPYGLPYKIGTATVKDQQIVNKIPLTIVNKSSVALNAIVDFKVDLVYDQNASDNSAKVAPTWETTLDATTATTTTAKDIVVSLEAFETGLTDETMKETATVNTQFANLKSEDAVMIVTPDDDGYNVNSDDFDTSKGKSDTTFTLGGTKRKLVLREGSADGLAQKGSIGFFRLSGFVAQNWAWASSDKFTATIKWTFKPDTYTVEAGTVAFAGGATSVAAGSNVVATVTPVLPNKVTVKEITWSSSNTTFADVEPVSTDSTGLTATVTGKAAGTTTITASVTGSDGIVYIAKKSITVSA